MGKSPSLTAFPLRPSREGTSAIERAGRTRLVRRVVFWATYPIIIVFQLLSNGILTGRRIVLYDPDAILGLRLVYAPVEDLFFGFAMVLLTLSVWVWLGRRGVQRTPRAGDGSWVLRRLRDRRRADERSAYS